MHAAYWAPLHWNALKKKKKEKRQKWCSILWDASELDWTSPAQTDTSAAGRGDECVEECRLPTPQPKSAFHGSAARTRETVAHLLQQLMYRKLLGSSRAPLCAKVLGSNWKVHRMLPRSCLKKHNKKKPSEESCTNQPASQRCLRNKRINLRYWNWHEAAGWMPTHISNWDVISQKEKKKKKRWLWRTRSVLSLWDQSAERLGVTVDLTFRQERGGGGIIKRVPSLDFPYGSVAPPLTPPVFLN